MRPIGTGTGRLAFAISENRAGHGVLRGVRLAHHGFVDLRLDHGARRLDVSGDDVRHGLDARAFDARTGKIRNLF